MIVVPYLVMFAVAVRLVPASFAQSAPTAPDSATPARPAAPMSRAPLMGTVVDEMNNPLAGVTVKLLGGSMPQLSITNSAGRYLLDVPTTGGTITVSFEGYQPQEFEFRKVSEIHVVLQPQPGFKRDRKQRVIYRRHTRALNAYPDR